MNPIYINNDVQFEFDVPIIDGFPILSNLSVYDIKIDAANRKWFATNEGVFYMNENATEVLL
ncbi:MAG: hypothetical protein AAF705_06985, partial [Bacteroidota bacterium]